MPKLLARLVSVIRTDPAAVQTAVQAAMGLVVSLGFALSARETGAIEGAVTAGLSLLVAIYTRPFRYATVTGFVSAAGTVLIAFRVPHITPGAVSAFNTVVTGFLMMTVTSAKTLTLSQLRRQAAGHVPEHARARG